MRNSMFASDAQQQALGFLIAQTTYIEPQVYHIRYPELFYAQIVPVDNSAPEWAKSITFFSVDWIGKADWINTNSSDLPLADFTRAKQEAGIETAGIGYRYNLEELGQAQLIPNTNLTTERANAARRAGEELIHNVALYGDSRKSWLGMTNHTGPSVVNAPNTWAFQLTQGAAGIAQILSDVNSALTGIWQASLTVEMANTLLLPLSSMSLLITTQLTNTTMNLFSWIMQNNIVTAQTGQALQCRAVRGLDTAGASGNGRMIAYRKDPEAIKLHVPMPHRFYAPYQKGAFVFEVPAMLRLAGLEWRLPGSARYVDGIC